MKNIYDILSALGVEVPGDKKAELDKELAANYKTVADYEKQTTKITSLTEQLKTATDGLKAFEGVDVNDLKGQIAKLQGDITAKETEYQGKIADMEFSGMLTQAISGAKGKSTKAILGELGEERLAALKSSKNQEADIKAALEGLKKESGYLFEEEKAPGKVNTGLTHVDPLDGDVDKFAAAAMKGAGLKTE